MKALLVVSRILNTISIVGLIALHLYCCYVAYVIGPFWKVVATFFLPVIADIYWLIISCKIAGGLSVLMLAAIILIVLFIVTIILFRIAFKHLENTETNM